MAGAKSMRGLGCRVLGRLQGLGFSLMKGVCNPDPVMVQLYT